LSEGKSDGCFPFWVAGLWFLMLPFALAQGQQQPVAFPHDKHLKIGLACTDCHTGADTHAAARIPSVSQCMLCHAKVARQKPEVKKVIAYADKKIEIPWQRIYKFDSTAHVKFDHSAHFRAKIACATCHGDLTKETVAVRSVTHTMGTCVRCHRQNHASQDCAVCHY